MVGRRENEVLNLERAKALRGALRAHQKIMEQQLADHYAIESERLRNEMIENKKRLEVIVTCEEKRIDEIVEETGKRIQWIENHLESWHYAQATCWEGRPQTVYDEYTLWERAHIMLPCPTKPKLAWWRCPERKLVDIVGLPPAAVSSLYAVYQPTNRTVYTRWETSHIDTRMGGDLTFTAMLHGGERMFRLKDHIRVCSVWILFCGSSQQLKN